MVNTKNWLRKAGAVSKRDALLQLTRIIAVGYQVGFALYLPAAKYTALPPIARTRWFVLYVVALIATQVIPFIPKSGQKRWALVDTSRLKTTSVATTQITACIREGRFTEADFKEIAQRLLVAIRFEVEGIVLDADGVYVNATLLTEDPQNDQNLLVRSRANTDRENLSYPKRGLVVWEAMEARCRKYQPHFEATGKDYRCILAFPLVIARPGGAEESIGVVSIDSGQAHEFDGLDDQIDTRLLPYLSLMKLLLSMRLT